MVAGVARAVAGGGDDGAALVEETLRTTRDLGEVLVGILATPGTRIWCQ